MFFWIQNMIEEMWNYLSFSSTTVWSKKCRGSLSVKDKGLECIFLDEKNQIRRQEGRHRTSMKRRQALKFSHSLHQVCKTNMEFTVKQMFGRVKASCQVKPQNCSRIKLGITWLWLHDSKWKIVLISTYSSRFWNILGSWDGLLFFHFSENPWK